MFYYDCAALGSAAPGGCSMQRTLGDGCWRRWPLLRNLIALPQPPSFRGRTARTPSATGRCLRRWGSTRLADLWYFGGGSKDYHAQSYTNVHGQLAKSTAKRGGVFMRRRLAWWGVPYPSRPAGFPGPSEGALFLDRGWMDIESGREASLKGEPWAEDSS